MIPCSQDMSEKLKRKNSSFSSIIERGLDAVVRQTNSILTVGTFDGVHLGHRKIIEDLVQRSKDVSGVTTLVTFDPHPREILLQQSLPRLTTIEERAAILSSLGLDRMVVLPFTEQFSKLSAKSFVTELLVGSIGFRTIVVGHDHRFGKNRTGNVDLLIALGKQYNFDVGVISPHIVGGSAVSSRRVRSLLQEKGDVALAAQLLGRSYSLTGRVIRGASRGKKLGYPTANLRLLDPSKVIPSYGVYAVNVQLQGILKGGMMNIGVRPAIKDSEGVHLEVHLFDFDKTIYGQELTVYFLERIRGERDFDSMEKLSDAMRKDEIDCRQILRASSLK